MLQEAITGMNLPITWDPVADSMGSAEHILQNHRTTRFRNSKDNHHMKLAILNRVFWCVVKGVVPYLQQLKLCSPDNTEISLKVIHFTPYFHDKLIKDKPYIN